MSSDISRLDSRVQKWIYKQGWQSLRDIQEQAIAPILSGDQDVIVSASTASGKTEAFFLPACSAIANNKESFGIIYISPLKALINDQYRRLEGLCELLDIQLVPWHGDSSQARKRKAKRSPSGILLITPESFESLLVREAGWARAAFSSLQYIVIDEFHAFIGSERGTQLLSQLNRLETLLDRQATPIPRVALSATLGNIETVPRALRRNSEIPYQIITGKQKNAELLTKIFGFIEKTNLTSDGDSKEGLGDTAEAQICNELYKTCRGGFHLIFANSRNRVESFAVQLSERCEYHNEFFPHHGSLAKELRESLESRLQKGNLPTTAVCTMTLELGIDIGKVDSVAQVTAPHSVSSLRQRLGRSGRRSNSSPVLRTYITESELGDRLGIADQLRMELLQSVAMIRLILTEHWFEPADTNLFHFSTLLHQVLALLAQWGGVRPEQIYNELCQKGPFFKTNTEHFKVLLTEMGSRKLITQLKTGELVLGVEGEKLASHYTFYAVFKTPEEFRIMNGAKSLGTLPIDFPVIADQHIVFGGRRWKVKDIDTDKKVIYVNASKGGKPPKFSGTGMSIHDRIREEMFALYSRGDHRIETEGQPLSYLNETAESLFNEGLHFFREANLKSEWMLQRGNNVCLIPWKGDKIINTLVFLLIKNGFTASAYAGVIEVEKTTTTTIRNCLLALVQVNPPNNSELAELVPSLEVDKFDEYLPHSLLVENYGQKAFDVESTVEWLKSKW